MSPGLGCCTCESGSLEQSPTFEAPKPPLVKERLIRCPELQGGTSGSGGGNSPCPAPWQPTGGHKAKECALCCFSIIQAPSKWSGGWGGCPADGGAVRPLSAYRERKGGGESPGIQGFRNQENGDLGLKKQVLHPESKRGQLPKGEAWAPCRALLSRVPLSHFSKCGA